MIEPSEVPAIGARWEAILRGESALAASAASRAPDSGVKRACGLARASGQPQIRERTET
jgi:hypothetical protein